MVDTQLQAPVGFGEAVEDWTGDARFFEYSQAADPIGDGVISAIPAVAFGAGLYATRGSTAPRCSGRKATS